MRLSGVIYRCVLLLLLASAGAAASCAPRAPQQVDQRGPVRAEAAPSPPRQGQTDEAEAGRNRALWESAGVANYRFVLRASCLCSLSPRSPVAVEVRAGKPVSVKPLTESKYFYFYRESYERHDTICKLFEAIQEALRRKAEVVSVSYDPARGYPKVIVIDEDTKFVDDEVTMWIEQFEVVE